MPSPLISLPPPGGQFFLLAARSFPPPYPPLQSETQPSILPYMDDPLHDWQKLNTKVK